MAEAIEFAAVILSRTLSPTRGLAHQVVRRSAVALQLQWRFLQLFFCSSSNQKEAWQIVPARQYLILFKSYADLYHLTQIQILLLSLLQCDEG